MSEGCTHDCSTCGESCSERKAEDMKLRQNDYSNIKKVIAVVSGKGGVGKSLVTSLLASASQARGFETAVMDADVTGPSIPKAFGIHERAMGSDEGMFPVESKTGIKIMSINLLLEKEDAPVVWRGPVISGVINQFWQEVLWGDVDYMFVDMPPGTGDIQLTLAQRVPVTGAVVVTTPQNVALLDAVKGINLFQATRTPIIGIVENMAVYTCSNCGHPEHIFGKDGGDKLARDSGTEVLGHMPLKPAIRQQSDSGVPTVAQDPESEESRLYRDIARKVGAKLALMSKDYSNKFPTISISTQS